MYRCSSDGTNEIRTYEFSVPVPFRGGNTLLKKFWALISAKYYRNITYYLCIAGFSRINKWISNLLDLSRRRTRQTFVHRAISICRTIGIIHMIPKTIYRRIMLGRLEWDRRDKGVEGVCLPRGWRKFHAWGRYHVHVRPQKYPVVERCGAPRRQQPVDGFWVHALWRPRWTIAIQLPSAEIVQTWTATFDTGKISSIVITIQFLLIPEDID